MRVEEIEESGGFAVRCVTTPPRGLVGNRALELQVPRLPDVPALQDPSAWSNVCRAAHRSSGRAGAVLAFYGPVSQKIRANRR